MRGYDLIIRFTSNPNDKQTTWVQVYKQPFHKWLIAWMYHWYEMHIYKVPGFRKFERWKFRHHYKKDGPVLTISDKQAIKCDFLHREGKVILVEFQVDETTYQSMRAK